MIKKQKFLMPRQQMKHVRSVMCWQVAGGCYEGYAKLTKVLCDHYGIQCIAVISNSHMWNGVKINGAWYIVDVTWNDNGYDIRAYLLKGSKNVTDEDHAISNSFYVRRGENGEKIPVTEYVSLMPRQ